MTVISSVTGNQSPGTILASAQDWRGGVSDLISWLVANDRCFSSGEIAALLRTYRPDFAFRVSGVGDYIRDQYDNGTFPQYGGVYPTQVPRVSGGIARTLDGRTVHSKTPVGQPVMVYAKDALEGLAHDFEVFIPDYDDPKALRALDINAQQQAAALAIVPAPTTAIAVTPQVSNLITGTLKRDDIIAYVRPDRRLCVPRAAFEAFVTMTGTPLRGGPSGDPVYIDFTPTGMVEITRDPAGSGTSVAYHLWSGRGRLAFQAGPNQAPFEPGDKYGIKVSPEALFIDLNTKV